MGLYDDWKNSRDVEEMTEEAAYALAIREYEAGERQDGAWGKAFAESEGNFDKAHALYIKIRAEQILRDAALFERLSSAAAKQPALEKSSPKKKERKRKKKKETYHVGWFWVIVSLGAVIFLANYLRG